MILGYLLTIFTVTYYCADAQYYSDYGDYDSNDPCAESPADPALACQRYTSCTQCADSVSNCYCDGVCHYYGDCCPDVEDLSSPVARVPEENVECQKLVVGDTYDWVSVITSCPSGVDLARQQKCGQGENLMVRGANSGLLYRNSYCAQCHAEDNSEPVTLSVFCKTDYPERETEAHSLILYDLLKIGLYRQDGVECQFNYSLYDENMRANYHTCNADVISTCASDAANTDSKKCRDEPASFVYTDNRDGSTGYPAYRNVWCARCNGLTEDQVLCDPPLYFGIGPPGRGFDSLVNLNTLSCVKQQIDSGDNQVEACDEGKFSCPRGQIYRPFQGCFADPSADDPVIELASGYSCKKWEFSTDYAIQDDIASIPSLNISSSDFVEQDDGVYICTLKNPGKASELDYDRNIPNAILTTVLVILSLICIIVHLALYAVFKPLRNVPGLIVMCLISSLFGALLLFLVSVFVEGNEKSLNHSACAALAACQHYLFLAAFFWTNVMAFDVAGMLNATLSSSKNKRKFIWYSLYAWGCPLLFTIAGLVATAYTESDKVKIEPAFGRKTCWINTKLGLLVYFLAPIFLILFVNIILYIVSIAAIVRAARQTKMVNPGLKERFYLALKLIVVMGLPWITSTFTAFIDSQALSYLFTILNASQGIFIFASYVLTRTVLNLFKKGEFRRSQKFYSSTRTSTFSLSKRYSGNSLSNSKSIKSQRISTSETNEQRVSTKRLPNSTHDTTTDDENNHTEVRGYTTTV